VTVNELAEMARRKANRQQIRQEQADKLRETTEYWETRHRQIVREAMARKYKLEGY
jgi:hypothetical protein